MATYLSVELTERGAENLNNSLIKEPDVYLVPTQKSCLREFLLAQAEPDKYWYNTGWGSQPLTFENWSKAYFSFYPENQLSLAIWPFDEEQKQTFQDAYDFLKNNPQFILQTTNWGRFVTEILEQPLTEWDNTLIRKEIQEEEDFWKSITLPKNEQELYEEKEWKDGKSVCLPLNTWGPSKMNILFANVVEPKLLRTKQFSVDTYNKFVKDNSGNCYALIPLVPLDSTTHIAVENIYTKLWDLSMREEPIMFISILYRNLGLVKTGSKDMEKIAQSWKEFYDKETLTFRYNFYKEQFENLPSGVYDPTLEKFVRTLKLSL